MPIQLVLEQPNLRKGESNFCVIHGLSLPACSVFQGTRAAQAVGAVGSAKGRGWVASLDYQGGVVVVVPLVLSALERLFHLWPGAGVGELWICGKHPGVSQGMVGMGASAFRGAGWILCEIQCC